MAEGDLCTLQQVADYLGIGVPGSGTPAERTLTRLITAASTSLKQILSDPIVETDHDDRYPAHFQRTQVLRFRPVIAVYGVTVDGIVIPRRSSERGAGWWLDAPRMLRFTDPLPRGTLRVRYVAGYPVDAVPADVTDAVIDTVALAFKRKDTLDVASKTLADQSISYVNSAMRARAKAIVDSRRDVVPA